MRKALPEETKAMRCETVLPLLHDFADHSLPLAPAWRVRRHLKHCADCQKAWAEVQAFGYDVQALYAASSVAPSPMLRTRTLHEAKPLYPAPFTLRRSLAGGIAAFSGAATVVAVIVALVWVTPGTPVRPTVAFAQVEAAMQQVKTVHWIETIRTNQGVNGPWKEDYASEKWARLDPPALLEKHLRVRDTRSKKTVLSTAAQAILKEQKNGIAEYTIIDQSEWNKIVGGSETKWIRSRIAREAIAPTAAKAGASLPGRTAPAPLITPWTSKTVMENQRPLILFEQRVFLSLPTARGIYRPALRQIHHVWAEPSSHHVVRRQSQYFTGAKYPETEVTADHFVYNENLPPSTFALPIPPGAIVKHESVLWTRYAWSKLSADEKKKIQNLIDRSDDAYRSTNFAEFVSVWDMDYLHQTNPVSSPEAEREKQWQLRIARQKNKWKVWSSHCVGGYEENSLFGAALPPGTPPLLCVSVMVTGQATTRAGVGKEWHSPATFHLRRVPGGGFKIVDWENAEALRAGWATIPELRTKRTK